MSQQRRAVLVGVGIGQVRPREKVDALDGSQSCGANREPSAGVEVLDKCCNTGEVVGVESRRPYCQGYRKLTAAFEVERESPKLGANLLAPSAEEDVAVLGEDRD